MTARTRTRVTQASTKHVTPTPREDSQGQLDCFWSRTKRVPNGIYTRALVGGPHTYLPGVRTRARRNFFGSSISALRILLFPHATHYNGDVGSDASPLAALATAIRATPAGV